MSTTDENKDLCRAITTRDPARTRQAIAAGADIDHISNVMPPLALAIVCNAIECMKVLLEAGARLDVADKLGRLPLSIAVANRKLEAASLLLKAGHEPDRCAPHTLGETPLMLAASFGDKAIMDLLLEHGAQPGIESQGMNACDFALSQGMYEIAKRLYHYARPKKDVTAFMRLMEASDAMDAERFRRSLPESPELCAAFAPEARAFIAATDDENWLREIEKRIPEVADDVMVVRMRRTAPSGAPVACRGLRGAQF